MSALGKRRFFRSTKKLYNFLFIHFGYLFASFYRNVLPFHCRFCLLLIYPFGFGYSLAFCVNVCVVVFVIILYVVVFVGFLLSFCAHSFLFYFFTYLSSPRQKGNTKSFQQATTKFAVETVKCCAAVTELCEGKKPFQSSEKESILKSLTEYSSMAAKLAIERHKMKREKKKFFSSELFIMDLYSPTNEFNEMFQDDREFCCPLYYGSVVYFRICQSTKIPIILLSLRCLGSQVYEVSRHLVVHFNSYEIDINVITFLPLQLQWNSFWFLLISHGLNSSIQLSISHCRYLCLFLCLPMRERVCVCVRWLRFL